MLQQLELRRCRGIEIDAAVGGEGLERLSRAIRPEILRHGALDVLHRHRAAPAPERRRHWRQFAWHEHVGLQPLDRGRLAHQRECDIGQHIERQAPQHTVHQWRQVGAEQRLRAKRLDAERSVLDEQRADGAAVDEARQKQRVAPHREADQHSAHGAARRSAPPDQAAKERGRKLRNGRERQQADRGELRGAQRAEIEIRHDHDGENRDATDFQHEPAEVLVRDLRVARQDERNEKIVRHHDRQCDALHDHHRGRGRQSADEDDDGEQRRLAFDRQRQHEHIAVDPAERKRHQPGQRDRNDEQIDGDEIKRKQPARALDFLEV